MKTFVPGLKLSHMFYHDVVRPIIEAQFPDLKYAAALIGSGSEVLGFDTEMSTDHHWGPRVMIFLPSQAEYDRYASSLNETLRHELPYTFEGFSVNFSEPNPDDNNTQLLEEISEGEVNHRVEIFVLSSWFKDYLGVDVMHELSVADWLAIPTQKLRSVVNGEVFHDETGKLTEIREKLAWYPEDVWLYIMASYWTRIGQEEHVMSRAGYVGNEISSRMVAAQLVKHVMNLIFLMHKDYAPYDKWFGIAFTRLPETRFMMDTLMKAMSTPTWREREENVNQIYRRVADMHNELAITEPLTVEPTHFHDRPFRVIHGERFASALINRISDPEVKRIAEKTMIGSVNVFSNNTDLLENTALISEIKGFYE